MREKWKNHKSACLFAALLGVVVLWCLMRMAMPEKIWAFDAQELERPGESGLYFDANVIDDNSPGWYVDNSLEYGEVFTQTPALTLPVGSYNITIFYKSQGDGASYSFISDWNTYRVIMGRTHERLESGRISKTMTANFAMPIERFQVTTEYTGDGYLLVNGVEIRQTRKMEQMILFGSVFMALCWLLHRWIRKEKRLKSVFWWGIGIAVATTLPMMMPYVYQGDDLYFHLLRIEGIAEAWRTGQFPARIQPEWMNGYGYSVSVFYGDGVLWIAGVLCLIGFPLQMAYKMYLFLVSLMTFGLTYFALYRIVKEHKISVVGAVLYTLAPYRMMNIYIRAAVGEYTALAFLPLILAGAYEILMKDREERRYSWLVLAAGMTGIIQSHILTCEIVVFTLGITCLICFRRTFERSRFFDFVKAVVGTVLVNMGFLIPLLDYMRDDLYVKSESFWDYIQTNGTFFSQLCAIFPHGYGFEKSIGDGLSPEPEKTFSLGAAFLLCLLLFGAGKKKWTDTECSEQKLGNYCSLTGCILAVMSTVWFPWDFLYDLNPAFEMLISRMQFPWRLLGTASLMMTVVACIVLWNWKREKKREEFIGLIVVLFGLAGLTAGYFTNTLMEKNDVLYIPDVESISTFELVSGEYVPDGVDWSRKLMPEGKVWHSEMVEVIATEKYGTNYILNCSNLSPEIQNVELPMVYYRGYVAKDQNTGGNVLVDAGENGRVRLTLAGNYEGTVRVKFQEPLLWRFSEFVTLLSVIGIIIYLVREKKLCKYIRQRR